MDAHLLSTSLSCSFAPDIAELLGRAFPKRIYEKQI